MDRYMRFSLPALLVVFTAVCGLPGQAPAQTYPSRPIHLVTGNPPGGATDFTARAIGQPLGVRLGQGVVIDNRPGANGNISAEVVAKAVPDGYTLLYANDSLMVVNPHIYSKMSVNLMQDLVPVVTTISNQLVLAVNPQVIPVNDFPAFVEFARKPATPLFYASIGNGSHHHLAMEMLKQRAGIDLTHVPYKGGGPASIAAGSVELRPARARPGRRHHATARRIRCRRSCGSLRTSNANPSDQRALGVAGHRPRTLQSFRPLRSTFERSFRSAQR